MPADGRPGMYPGVEPNFKVWVLSGFLPPLGELQQGNYRIPSEAPVGPSKAR